MGAALDALERDYGRTSALSRLERDYGKKKKRKPVPVGKPISQRFSEALMAAGTPAEAARYARTPRGVAAEIAAAKALYGSPEAMQFRQQLEAEAAQPPLTGREPLGERLLRGTETLTSALLPAGQMAQAAQFAGEPLETAKAFGEQLYRSVRHLPSEFMRDPVGEAATLGMIFGGLAGGRAVARARARAPKAARPALPAPRVTTPVLEQARIVREPTPALPSPVRSARSEVRNNALLRTSGWTDAEIQSMPRHVRYKIADLGAKPHEVELLPDGSAIVKRDPVRHIYLGAEGGVKMRPQQVPSVGGTAVTARGPAALPKPVMPPPPAPKAKPAGKPSAQPVTAIEVGKSYETTVRGTKATVTAINEKGIVTYKVGSKTVKRPASAIKGWKPWGEPKAIPLGGAAAAETARVAKAKVETVPSMQVGQFEITRIEEPGQAPRWRVSNDRTAPETGEGIITHVYPDRASATREARRLAQLSAKAAKAKGPTPEAAAKEPWEMTETTKQAVTHLNPEVGMDVSHPAYAKIANYEIHKLGNEYGLVKRQHTGGFDADWEELGRYKSKPEARAAARADVDATIADYPDLAAKYGKPAPAGVEPGGPYRYRATMRPPGYGSVPEGYQLVRAVDPGTARQWDYGTLEYKKPLTAEQAKHFDLVPEPIGMERLPTTQLVETLTGVPAIERSTTTVADHKLMAQKAHGKPTPEAAAGVYTWHGQSGQRVRITAGEYEGKTGTVLSAIKKEFNAEVPVLRIQLDGFPIKGGWNGQVPIESAKLESLPSSPTAPAPLKPGGLKSEGASPTIGAKADLFLAEREATAKARLKEHLGGEGGFISLGGRAPKGVSGKLPSPAVFADWAEIGAIKVARGAVKFAEWSSEMIAEYGEAIRPHLDRIWAASNKFYRETLKMDIDAIGDVGMRYVKALKIARAKEPEKAILFAEGRKRQAGALHKIRWKGKYPDTEAAKVARGAMKGEFERPELELGSNWTPEDMAELKGRLRNSPRLTDHEWHEADFALTDLLLRGKQPEPRMYAVFAREFGPAFVKGLRENTPLYIRALQRSWIEGNGILRAVLTTADNSWNLMQGFKVALSAPRTFARGVAKSTRALLSEDFAQKAFQDLRAQPLYDDAMRHGLRLYDIDVGSAASLRPDEWVSTAIEKIPLLGKIPRASSRAFQTAANTVRYDLYRRQVELYDSLAGKPNPWTKALRGQTTPLTSAQKTGLAREVNAFTGHGFYGKAETAGHILGAPFFSLRNLAGMIESPFFMMHPDPVIRRVAIERWTKYAGLTVSAIGAAKMMGADVETDARSSDFGKIKIGKTRVDMTGGHGLFIRYLVQFYTGERKVLATGEIKKVGRTETVGRFLRTKASPLVGGIWSAIEKKNMVGEPFDFEHWTTAVRNQATPMVVQDMIDAAERENMWRAAWVAPLSFFGQRQQTFEAKPKGGVRPVLPTAVTPGIRR